MKIKLIIAALVALMLTGCNLKNGCESICAYGKTVSKEDNINIFAPKGYFLNGYEFVKIDDHTMQLVLTLTDNKDYGEI